jgi:hypothetical protein
MSCILTAFCSLDDNSAANPFLATKTAIYNLFVQALETGLEKQSFVRYFWHDSQRVHINIQFASVD